MKCKLVVFKEWKNEISICTGIKDELYLVAVSDEGLYLWKFGSEDTNQKYPMIETNEDNQLKIIGVDYGF